MAACGIFALMFVPGISTYRGNNNDIGGTAMGVARRRFLKLAAGAAVLPALSGKSWAIDYPTRPVRFVVGFPPAGFTDTLLTELRSYRHDRDALILCVPESEHRRLTRSELLRIQDELQSNAELVCLDSNGDAIDIRHRPRASRHLDAAVALTSMRRHITDRCDARVILGGKLTEYQGTIPGILEEASMSLHAGQPLYVAGGFGGAAAALALALGRADATLAPDDYPNGAAQHANLLAEIEATEGSTGRAEDGLSDDQRAQLAWSHRPGEIASIVVYGLSRRSH